MEPESEAARAPWWRHPLSLAALVGLLVLFSMVTLRSSGPREAGQSARLALETQLRSRQIYGMRSLTRASSTGRQAARDLLRDLRRLAEDTRAPGAYRRLAIMQYALGEEGWRESLAALRQLPGADAFQRDRELAAWRTAFGEGRPAPEAVQRARQTIDSLSLGWYRYPALEALYRNAGDHARADAFASRGKSAAIRLTLLSLLAFLIGLAGTGILLGLLFYIPWRRRNPEASVPAFLQLTPPGPLTRAKAEALHTVFLAYLISYAVITMGLRGLLRGALEDAPHSLLPVVSVLVMLLWLSVPLITYLRVAPRAGLRPEEIGLRSRSLLVDVLWGAAGWAAALPVLFVVLMVSSYLLRGFETPMNPAILELASRPDLLSILALFLQAAILAPVSEEILFRGVFYRSLTARVSRAAAVLIASAVFAILHPQLPLGFAGIFTLGALFNLLYLARGSLVPAITAHAINNGAILTFVLTALGD